MTRHIALHFALAAVYLLTAALLFTEAAYVHSACVAILALIYGLIAWPAARDDK